MKYLILGIIIVCSSCTAMRNAEYEHIKKRNEYNYNHLERIENERLQKIDGNV